MVTFLKMFPLLANEYIRNIINSNNFSISFADFADVEARGKKKKYRKKFKKFLLPLLLAYKLKFFTLIPVFIGMLVLLTGATGLAGFFFALFAAVMGLKSHGGHSR